MILTLRPNKTQEENINKVKKIYGAKSSTVAIYRAVQYIAYNLKSKEELIDTLKEEVVSLKEKDQRLKSMIKQIKQVGSRLSDYCEMP